MSAFDIFERRLGDALDDLASPQFPDYFDDVLAVAVSRPQRPAWTFPERWLPVSAVTRPTVFTPPLPWRTIGILLALLALLVATAVTSMGLRRDDPAPPFGLAENGLIAYLADGDIYTRDLESGEQKLVIGGTTDDVFPLFSRDGLSLAFIRLAPEGDDTADLMVSNADGTAVRSLLGDAVFDGLAWSPDSTEIAVIHTSPDGSRVLSLVPTDGSGATALELPVEPAGDVLWRPPDGSELIFQARDGERRAIYGVRPDGTGFRQVSDPSTIGAFSGPYEVTADGSEMFFTRIDTDFRPSVRVLDLETGEQRAFGEALPPPPDWDGKLALTGSPSISADGESVVFGRYWNEANGLVNHQLWIASVHGDGSDAVPLGPVHRSRSGHNPFYQAFAPDGTAVLVHTTDTSETWIADPTDGSVQAIDWGEVHDPPSWQRRAP